MTTNQECLSNGATSAQSREAYAIDYLKQGLYGLQPFVRVGRVKYRRVLPGGKGGEIHTLTTGLLTGEEALAILGDPDIEILSLRIYKASGEWIHTYVASD